MVFCLLLYLMQLIGDLIVVLHSTQLKGSNKKD